MKKNGKQATSCEKEPQAVGKLSSFERNVGAERASSPTTSVVSKRKDGAGGEARGCIF